MQSSSSSSSLLDAGLALRLGVGDCFGFLEDFAELCGVPEAVHDFEAAGALFGVEAFGSADFGVPATFGADDFGVDTLGVVGTEAAVRVFGPVVSFALFGQFGPDDEICLDADGLEILFGTGILGVDIDGLATVFATQPKTASTSFRTACSEFLTGRR